MKKSIKRKPISNSEYNIVYGKNPMTDLVLNTGVRIAEAKRLVDEYNIGDDYLDIKTKKSSTTNRIYLNESAKENLNELQYLVGKDIKTYTRLVKKVSLETGVDFTAHNLRVTFATRLLELGVDLVSIQHLMNHSDVSMTAQYIQFNETKLKASLSMLDDYKTMEGYTLPEAMREIVRLRAALKRQEKK